MSEKAKIKRLMHDLGNALKRFQEMLEVSTDDRDYALDATIQRFEFSFELFWKTLRVLLDDAGIQANNPRQVLSEAYSQEWINEEKTWLSLLKARNLTSHVYNEQRAQEIYQMILENAPLMHAEYEALKERFSEYLQ